MPRDASCGLTSFPRLSAPEHSRSGRAARSQGGCRPVLAAGGGGGSPGSARAFPPAPSLLPPSPPPAAAMAGPPGSPDWPQRHTDRTQCVLGAGRPVGRCCPSLAKRGPRGTRCRRVAHGVQSLSTPLAPPARLGTTAFEKLSQRPTGARKDGTVQPGGTQTHVSPTPNTRANAYKGKRAMCIDDSFHAELPK